MDNIKKNLKQAAEEKKVSQRIITGVYIREGIIDRIWHPRQFTQRGEPAQRNCLAEPICLKLHPQRCQRLPGAWRHSP